MLRKRRTGRFTRHGELIFSNEWLRDKIASDPDVEAAIASPPSVRPSYIEHTEAGVIDWKMEAERANRLLAETEARLAAVRPEVDREKLRTSIESLRASYYMLPGVQVWCAETLALLSANQPIADREKPV